MAKNIDEVFKTHLGDDYNAFTNDINDSAKKFTDLKHKEEELMEDIKFSVGAAQQELYNTIRHHLGNTHEEKISKNDEVFHFALAKGLLEYLKVLDPKHAKGYEHLLQANNIDELKQTLIGNVEGINDDGDAVAHIKDMFGTLMEKYDTIGEQGARAAGRQYRSLGSLIEGLRRGGKKSKSVLTAFDEMRSEHGNYAAFNYQLKHNSKLISNHDEEDWKGHLMGKLPDSYKVKNDHKFYRELDLSKSLEHLYNITTGGGINHKDRKEAGIEYSTPQNNSG